MHCKISVALARYTRSLHSLEQLIIKKKNWATRELNFQNDYKTFKQATGTMIPLVYVGSIVI